MAREWRCGLMRLWTPPREEPELLAWWAPLLLVARKARHEGVPWPIHVDQFDLLGRVDRAGGRPPVWVYRHQESGGDIYADPSGQTYLFRPTPNAAGPGRFDRCEVRAGVHLAGIAQVVEPAPQEPAGTLWSAETHERAMAAHPTAQRRPSCRSARQSVRRQDRWLHVVPAMLA